MKIKKKNRLISVCLVLALAACATIGGVLAMDAIAENTEGTMLLAETSAEATDDINIISQQRGYDEEGEYTLIPYKNGTMLYPLVGSAQYNGDNFDKYGMPTAEGYVDQIIRIKNESNCSRYVRLLVAIPAALESIDGDASKNALHWNLGNRFRPNGDFLERTEKNQNYGDYYDYKCVDDDAIVRGIKCNIYAFTYLKPLTAKNGTGDTTELAAFVGFYLDKDVNVKDGKVYLDNVPTGYQGTTVDIAVKAQSVQAEGLPKEDALAQLGQMTINPWAEEDSTNSVTTINERNHQQ